MSIEMIVQPTQIIERRAAGELERWSESQLIAAAKMVMAAPSASL